MPTENLIVSRIKKSLPHSVDLIVQHAVNDRIEVDFLYFSSAIDHSLFYRLVSVPLFDSSSYEQFIDKLSVFGAQKSTNITDTVSQMLQGSIVVVYYDDIICLHIKKTWNEDPEQTLTENVVLGSNKAFPEDITSKLSIIRTRYKRQELSAQQFEIGTTTHTKVMLVFDRELAKPDVITLIQQQLCAINVDVLQSSGQLEKLLNKRRYSLFPSMMITERPDRATLSLAQGKAVILVEDTQFVLILPAVFFDFMSAMDDLYQSFGYPGCS